MPLSISEGWLRSKPSSEVRAQLSGLSCSPGSGSYVSCCCFLSLVLCPLPWWFCGLELVTVLGLTLSFFTPFSGVLALEKASCQETVSDGPLPLDDTVCSGYHSFSSRTSSFYPRT